VRTSLIIPAAGSGVRLGAATHKALVEVGGRALVRLALEPFRSIEHIVEAIVVAPPGSMGEIGAALKGLDWPGCELRLVAGGETRQASVRNGIKTIAGDVSLVCVHDAARPLVTVSTVLRVLAAAAERGAATAASRPADSLRQDCEGGGTQPLDREKVWLVETPQAFRYDLIRRAHERAAATRVTATDDATLAEQCAGARIAVVESDALNLKVTKQQDLAVVRAILEALRD